jgi:hypothetical protein
VKKASIYVYTRKWHGWGQPRVGCDDSLDDVDPCILDTCQDPPMPRAPINLPLHFDLISAPQAERWERGREGGREGERQIFRTRVSRLIIERPPISFLCTVCACVRTYREGGSGRGRYPRGLGAASNSNRRSLQHGASTRARAGHSRHVLAAVFESLPLPAASRKSSAHCLIWINAGVCHMHAT